VDRATDANASIELSERVCVYDDRWLWERAGLNICAWSICATRE
jgi:hypothetical protein